MKTPKSVRSQKAKITKQLAATKKPVPSGGNLAAPKSNIVREKGKTLRRGLLGWDTLKPGGKGSI